MIWLPLPLGLGRARGSQSPGVLRHRRHRALMMNNRKTSSAQSLGGISTGSEEDLCPTPPGGTSWRWNPSLPSPLYSFLPTRARNESIEPIYPSLFWHIPACREGIILLGLKVNFHVEALSLREKVCIPNTSLKQWVVLILRGNLWKSIWLWLSLGLLKFCQHWR